MDRTKDLYEEPVVIETGEEEIRKDVLGEADFGRGTIKIPTFANAYMEAMKRGDGVMKGVIDGIKDYIWGHERYVEFEGRPQNKKQELSLEADYMQRLEDQALYDNSFTSWAKYLSALTLHEKRAENGVWFSTGLKSYYNLKEKARQYNSDMKKRVRNYMDWIFEPRYQTVELGE